MINKGHLCATVLRVLPGEMSAKPSKGCGGGGGCDGGRVGGEGRGRVRGKVGWAGAAVHACTHAHMMLRL